MPEGFFSPAALQMVKQPASLIPKCGICALYKGCRSPKMPAQGSGRRSALIVGEAPGRNEDSAGKQFVGDAGIVLKQALKKIGIDLFLDCVVTNALICRPGPDNVIKDKRAIDYCRPNLLQTIDYYDPKLIILLGSTAVKSLIGHLWKDEVGGIKRWAGWKIPCHEPNAWICPTFHPSFIMRANKRERPLYDMIFERHLKNAFDCEDRPWETPPDYRKEVEVTQDAEHAAKVIRRMIEKGGTVAFDIECNMLKPDSDAARIVGASVCWEGKKTIAYPWRGEVVEATKEMLLSPRIGKISHNLKYEDRWVRSRLGLRTVRWVWDSMIQSHVLDSRRGISSLKFQAFCRLGQGDYDGHIKPYLAGKQEGGNSENRIKEVELPMLLTYCGLDSLLTYKIAMQQMRELGIRLRG